MEEQPVVRNYRSPRIRERVCSPYRQGHVLRPYRPALHKNGHPTVLSQKLISHFSKRYISILIVIFSIVGTIAYLQDRPVAEIAYLLVAQMVSAYRKDSRLS